MLLEKNQIDRYPEFTLAPQISRISQKKIYKSSAAVYSKEIRGTSSLLYYLAAAGVGQLHCHMDNSSGWDKLKDNLIDLNSEGSVLLHTEENADSSASHSTSRIISGNFNYVKEALNDIIKSVSHKEYVPTIVSIYNGWYGAVQTFTEYSALMAFSAAINDFPDFSAVGSSGFNDDLSACFSNLLAVIEHIKVALSVGKPLSDPLYFNLSTMDFDFVSTPTDLLYKLLGSRISVKNGRDISDSKVLIIGCGSLGSSAAFSLASAGVGKLGLVDFDIVGQNDLNHQIMHTSSRIGMPKVQSAGEFLKSIYPNIQLELYETKVNKFNIHDIISSYDVVIGGLDNVTGRYILNDACYKSKKPLIEAGTLDISGFATTIIPESGHCYRCIFPETEDSSLLPSYSEACILSLVSGFLGIIQAAEATKLLTGIGKPLKNRLLLFDVLDTDIYVSEHRKNFYCELCGSA